MKLTFKKVLTVNIILLLILICSKIWYFKYFNKMAKVLYNSVGARTGANFTNLYLQLSNDVLIVIPDFSVYIIIIGLIINLILYVVVLKKFNLK
jgi:hypothetical protein